VLNTPLIKSKLARSRTLALLGKSTSRSKNGILPTSELWKGIHFTKDIRPSESQSEHEMRVLGRENTPYVISKSNFSARFAPVKDKFVERYEPLLKENERRNNMEIMAKRSRDFLLQIKD